MKGTGIRKDAPIGAAMLFLLIAGLAGGAASLKLLYWERIASLLFTADALIGMALLTAFLRYAVWLTLMLLSGLFAPGIVLWPILVLAKGFMSGMTIATCLALNARLSSAALIVSVAEMFLVWPQLWQLGRMSFCHALQKWRSMFVKNEAVPQTEREFLIAYGRTGAWLGIAVIVEGLLLPLLLRT